MQQHPIADPAPFRDLPRVVLSFQALADPTRTLLWHLISSESRVSDLVQRLAQPQSTISRHLAVLRRANLVKTRRSGTHVYYRLCDAHVADLLHQAFAHAKHERLGLPDHEAHHPSTVQSQVAQPQPTPLEVVGARAAESQA